MADQTHITFFNKAYDDTYGKTLLYVTKKCGDPCDIADILQETYAEFFSVIVKKGARHIKNSEAFVMRIAKTKICRHYTQSQRAKIHVPLFGPDGGEEYANEPLTDGISIEDSAINNLLLKEISHFIKAKAGDVQRIFYMYFHLDMTAAQIAEELSLKESTVKSKIHRAVKEIRTIYGKDGAAL